MLTKDKYQKNITHIKNLKNELTKIDKSSPIFKYKAKKYLKLLIETKASTWCLDNIKEQTKLQKLIVRDFASLIFQN
jgi:hypothetical protein